ncbi:hypothetical protein DP2151 [Desulfotalea psychrophila LSv54]|uniref:DUF2878 domain-containing protein n=2 Tax=Desulfotalea psychrophila TaxID=84980 RepID=Q6AL95_DESPS|nr:hypothetical protein DP2151 [Desulfotalea psychrophila LSv54]
MSTLLQPDLAIDSHRPMKTLINVLIYQSIWFLSILGGNSGAWFGLLLLCAHLFYSATKSADLRMIGALFVAGLLLDGTLHQVGFFSFTETGFPIPFWLLVIWLGLAITPNHSLAWLQKKPLLAMLFGTLGGPIAYWAGVRMGAAHFNWELLPSLGTLAVIWGLLWPLVMHLSVISTKRSQTRLLTHK